jgi:hypothetical protein
MKKRRRKLVRKFTRWKVKGYDPASIKKRLRRIIFNELEQDETVDLKSLVTEKNGW